MHTHAPVRGVVHHRPRATVVGHERGHHTETRTAAGVLLLLLGHVVSHTVATTTWPRVMTSHVEVRAARLLLLLLAADGALLALPLLLGVLLLLLGEHLCAGWPSGTGTSGRVLPRPRAEELPLGCGCSGGLHREHLRLHHHMLLLLLRRCGGGRPLLPLPVLSLSVRRQHSVPLLRMIATATSEENGPRRRDECAACGGNVCVDYNLEWW